MEGKKSPKAVFIVHHSVYFTGIPKKTFFCGFGGLFPTMDLAINSDEIRGESKTHKDLLHFADSIRTHQNLDSSRRVMRKSFVEDIIRLDFDKQAALHNRFHFCDPDDAPLGTIILQIITPDPEVLIDILAPKWEWIKPIKRKKRRERNQLPY